MRSQDDIQEAHDRLVGILTGDVPNPFTNPESNRDLNIAAGVLCWILEHEHNTAFADNLAEITQVHKAMDWHLIKKNAAGN